MIERVSQRAQTETITNLEAKVADVHQLPFEDGVFDAICMIAVISEIPRPEQALHEFYRVLKPSGTLAFSELFSDPDYPLAKTLIRKANKANFQLKSRAGNFFSYTLIFNKQELKTA
jgi:ubiquinone/menaquinone biosynthesis C-methylase UbiE